MPVNFERPQQLFGCESNFSRGKVDIENIVETEDKKQGKTDTSSPSNKKQFLSAQEEEDGNEAYIETIVD
jgi:hypothetical protein